MKSGDLIKIRGFVYDENANAKWSDGVGFIIDAHQSIVAQGTEYYEVSYNGLHGYTARSSIEVIDESR